MNINLIYGEYFSERSPHFFLHFAVHRADCLQILRDKSQLGLRGADSIVEENFSSANISSLAHKSHPITSQKSLFPPPDWPSPVHSSQNQFLRPTFPPCLR